jgi:hypothetical protein
VTLPVVWLPEADADLKEALTWYEGIHPDLGLRFALAPVTFRIKWRASVNIIWPSWLAVASGQEAC